jgi:hypothetical protein
VNISNGKDHIETAGPRLLLREPSEDGGAPDRNGHTSSHPHVLKAALPLDEADTRRCMEGCRASSNKSKAARAQVLRRSVYTHTQPHTNLDGSYGEGW